MPDDTDLEGGPSTADDENEVPERPDIDAEKQRELIEKTKEAKESAEQQHNEMLEAVAEGEDWNVEDYEWVELGGVELKVKTWLPGDTMDRMGALGEAAETQDPSAAREMVHGGIESLTTQTEIIQSGGAVFETNSDIRQFWQNYTEKWGNKGLEKAIETVMGPIEDEQERKEETMRSFRGDGHR
jgi:hypothetical protein